MAAHSIDKAKSLVGRVALVTGAAKRIGRAVALRLAKEGADVVVHYRGSKSAALETAGEVERSGRRALIVQADLRNVDEIERMVERAGAVYGRLDVLVNNAAVFEHLEFGKTSEAQWDATLETNLKAPFFCAQAAAPLLKKNRGVIVNFGDIGGILAWPGYIPHCASKAGVAMLTRCLAKTLAPEIRVNAIAPGTISMEDDSPEWQRDYIRRAPLGQSGTPEDVADAVVFLIQAEFLTGQVLVLDGGRTL